MNWERWLPGLATLREYKAGWLRDDIVAGLVLTTMLAPVGIAYAVASGLPSVCGLYATLVPLLAYSLFGPSRIMVLGPNSALVGTSYSAQCRHWRQEIPPTPLLLQARWRL